MNLVWSEDALANLDAIVEWIAREAGDGFAAKWASGVFDRVDILATHPLAGRRVPELSSDDFRELLYRSLRIIYHTAPDACTILAVRHARQLTTPGNFGR
ncbi:MAG: type II toxin-antitoxin system RelE/ParE family toxin [Kiritimatiellae bacterium]|nr:type II toxin-antitoxin system RelE/ParE family toxin [Kiritimatiellia bacterium]